jgi:predicted helicase
LDENLAQQLAAGMGCTYTFDEARAWQHGQAGEVLPLDILDYSYAVLHSRAYREKYKEFLKIDFPRVPWPTDEVEFRRLVALGAELRQYHLMEHPALDEKARAIGYPVQGSNTVENSMTTASPGFVADGRDAIHRVSATDGGDTGTNAVNRVSTGNVFINATQHFTRVPLRAWEFYIGGYQPAQKWLKDRKGRTLTFDDIQHYRKIIAALSETDRLMGEIDGDGN